MLSWSRGDPSSNLSCRLVCHNLDAVARPLTFTSALHAYFTVSDISNVAVSSGAGLSYLDQLQRDDAGRPRLVVADADQTDIRFSAELDRIYFDAFAPERQNTMLIRDSGLQRAFKVSVLCVCSDHILPISS